MAEEKQEETKLDVPEEQQPVYDPKAPLTPDEVGWIQNTLFHTLQANQFKGGLPVFTAVPTYTGKFGEIVLVDDTSSLRKVCAYLSETWRCQTLGTSPLTFTEVNTVSINPSISATWDDWDLSAYIPVGTVAVQIFLFNNTDIDVGVRKNGSSAQPIINDAIHSYVTVGVGSDRIIETYTADEGASVEFILVGYWS